MADNPEIGPDDKQPEATTAQATADEELAKTRKQYEDLRSEYNRRDKEIRDARAQAAQMAELYQRQQQQTRRRDDDDDEAPGHRAMADPILNQRLGLAEFKLDYPDWQKDWTEIQEIINDPQKAAEVASFDAQGQPDVKKSLENARLRVRNARLEAAEAKAAEARAKMEAQRAQLKSDSTISGGGGSDREGEQVDLSGMTSDEMLEKFGQHMDIDPNDPIRPTTRRGPAKVPPR